MINFNSSFSNYAIVKYYRPLQNDLGNLSTVANGHSTLFHYNTLSANFLLKVTELRNLAYKPSFCLNKLRNYVTLI